MILWSPLDTGLGVIYLNSILRGASTGFSNKSKRLRSDSTATYVALLRGVNVGGRNKLSMADLVAMFQRAGCEASKSYIQSGNMVFKASRTLAAGIPTLIASEITERFGYRIPLVVRTVEELREIVSTNPFLSTGVDSKRLYVMFLADEPESNRVAKLDPQRSPQDLFQVRGSEVFLYCPNGLGRTKLTNEYFDSKLATTSTVRNWRTVLTLLQMADR